VRPIPSTMRQLSPSKLALTYSRSTPNKSTASGNPYKHALTTASQPLASSVGAGGSLGLESDGIIRRGDFGGRDEVRLPPRV